MRKILLHSSVLLILTTTFLGAQNTTPNPPPGEIDINGVAFDGSKFWVPSVKEKKIVSFDRELQKRVSDLPLSIEDIGGITFAGKYLVLAKKRSPALIEVNTRDGKTVREIKIRFPQETGFDEIRGICWDKSYVWIAVFAGFSSAYYQVDINNDGKVINWVYADCNPKGIACDGKSLWSICYNGEGKPSKLDERPASGKAHEILKKRRFIKDIDAKQPNGLVFDGKRLVFGDQQTGRFSIFQPTASAK